MRVRDAADLEHLTSNVWSGAGIFHCNMIIHQFHVFRSEGPDHDNMKHRPQKIKRVAKVIGHGCR
jgi:hypothetical protein